MYVIGGSTSKSIANDIKIELNAKLCRVDIKRFPDDELYIRIIDDIFGENIIIIQNTYPDPNIIELFLLQDAAKEAGAKKITIIIPYFGYSRQDRKFKDGEPISARALSRLISSNADKVITIDPHKEHILNFFSIPSFSCSAISEIARYLVKQDIDMILAPDKGALNRVKKTSSIISCEFDYIEKKRLDGNIVEIKPKNLDVENKNVVILDDIISTGGTMAKSIEELKRYGARRIIAVCTHGLFACDAVRKLKNAGCDDIIATDTIDSEYSKIKTTPCIVPLLTSD